MSNVPSIGGVTLFTIGFAGHSAEEFFEKLRAAGVKKVVDLRLRNDSQLAGFAKKEDLSFFLRTISGIEYVHVLELAPTAELLDDFKKQRIDWPEYERRFKELLAQRQPTESLVPADLDRACLLCSEHEPGHCHRRLVAEYFQREWGSLSIEHL